MARPDHHRWTRVLRKAGIATAFVFLGTAINFDAVVPSGGLLRLHGYAYADEWAGYKEPGKEEKEKGSYARKEYEKHIETPGHALTGTERDLINLGCVGLCRVRQALPGMQEYPDKAPGVGCYLTLAQALNKQCEKGWRLFVFAKQGYWKNGTPATSSPVPPENVEAPYNYATYFPTDDGTWEYMNCNVEDAKKHGGQKVVVSGELPTTKPATIYCSHCVKGWSYPGKGDPKEFSKEAGKKFF